ncbi:MAG: hypothetical protein QOG53_1854 [Frankiales bacterium]|nr:hypothetical protein [Frankiales bacterium]
MLVGMTILYNAVTDAENMIAAELDGSIQGVADLVGKNNVGDYRHALWMDFFFIAGYLLFILAGGSLGRTLSMTSAGRRISTIAILGGGFAALCDIAEDSCLFWVISKKPDTEGLAVAAQALAYAKFVVIVPAMLVAAIAIWTTFWRGLLVPILRCAISRWRDEERVRAKAAEDVAAGTSARLLLRPYVDTSTAAGSVPQSGTAWRANNTLPDDRRETEPPIGFCVSGGGIRSGTFTFGALHALRSQLTKARYLISVSGGGYAAGAMQLALQQAPTRSLATPEDVYLAGTAELRYTRLHGKYIADGVRQWAVAIGWLLRGFVLNVLTGAILIALVGRVLAHAYARFPHDLLHPPSTNGLSPDLPWHMTDDKLVFPGLFWDLGVLAGLAIITWLIGVLMSPTPPATRRHIIERGLGAVSRGSVGLLLLLAFFGIGLPLVAWAAGYTLPDSGHSGAVLAATQPPALTLGFLSTLIALSHKPKVRTDAKKAVGRLRAWAASAGPGQKPLLQSLAVYFGLLVLAAAALLYFGLVLVNTRGWSDASSLPGGFAESTVTYALLGAAVFLIVVDQVRWSLHPFYRRRLASAFDVRRRSQDDTIYAEPYDYDSEITVLADPDKYGNDYGARIDGFPQVIFSCSAHVSGQDMAPPGRKVVPWTMSGDYIGSPVIGWASTEFVTSQVSETLRRDMTVQAASAISGAAIASQMGTLDKAYTRLLTLSNARLGSWLPNPAYIHAMLTKTESEGWLRPGLPRRRYLGTLGQELFGYFRADGPLVYVTDGGHYENLGLVELLRHRCATIYCVDASGDKRHAPTTLATAIEFAYEELGVEITFDTPRTPGRLGSGADTPLDKPTDQTLVELKDRLAIDCIAIGTIKYPYLGPGFDKFEGKLIFGKAVLTASTPFEVLSHALGSATFPNDTTADQWFDVAQFDAYHALGRHVGEQMRKA